MKTNIETVTPRVEGIDSFTARCLASCRKLLEQFESVKKQVVDEFRDQVEEHQHLLRLALNEAEALAWQTEYPELLFADLATEKAHAVADWHTRQQRLLRRTASAAFNV
jgi:hypothetical protein